MTVTTFTFSRVSSSPSIVSHTLSPRYTPSLRDSRRSEFTLQMKRLSGRSRRFNEFKEIRSQRNRRFTLIIIFTKSDPQSYYIPLLSYESSGSLTLSGCKCEQPPLTIITTTMRFGPLYRGRNLGGSSGVKGLNVNDLCAGGYVL